LPIAPEHITVGEEYKKVRSLIEAETQVVFVTGSAGTGKSMLIHYLRGALTRRIVVVAPTGVAALNVGGPTIHSFFHLPPKIHEDEDVKLLEDRRLYTELDVLIIDEISMVRCDLIDSIDRFLRLNRSDSRPFGGVQLVLVGDLCQLPPVAPRTEWDALYAKGYAHPWFFGAFAFETLSMSSVELQHVHRQVDPEVVELLNRLRLNENLDAVVGEINRRCGELDGFSPHITLTCTNAVADQINLQGISRLPDPQYAFTGTITGQFAIEEDKLPSPLELKLKRGARVMFTRNDEGRRWVNGTLGIVTRLDDTAVRVTLLSDGRTYDVCPATWETYRYVYDLAERRIVARKVGEYRQYPLMLAWAVTIHKSQGKTMDNVLIDLGHGAFASGQAYVALSRCSSIDRIRLARPLEVSDIRLDPIVKRFYRALDELSKAESA